MRAFCSFSACRLPRIGRYGRVVVLGRSVFKREEVPVAWDSLKLLRSAARQYNAGSDKGVANGLADEDLVSLCEPNYAGGDVHRNTREVVSMVFDFAQVYAAAHSEAECRCCRFDRACDLDGDRRTPDHREEVVASRADFSSVVAIKFCADQAAEVTEKIAPRVVTHRHNPVRRLHNVSEEHDLERAVDVCRRPCTGKELRDFAGDPSGSPFEHFVCFDFDVSCAGNVLGQVTAVHDRNYAVRRRMDDERRHRDLAKQVADIDGEVSIESLDAAGASVSVS